MLTPNYHGDMILRTLGVSLTDPCECEGCVSEDAIAEKRHANDHRNYRVTLAAMTYLDERAHEDYYYGADAPEDKVKLYGNDPFTS